jgi:hypothetical protein
MQLYTVPILPVAQHGCRKAGSGPFPVVEARKHPHKSGPRRPRMEDTAAVRIGIANVDFIGYLVDGGALQVEPGGMRIPSFGLYLYSCTLVLLVRYSKVQYGRGLLLQGLLQVSPRRAVLW